MFCIFKLPSSFRLFVYEKQRGIISYTESGAPTYPSLTLGRFLKIVFVIYCYVKTNTRLILKTYKNLYLLSNLMIIQSYALFIITSQKFILQKLVLTYKGRVGESCPLLKIGYSHITQKGNDQG